MAVPVVATLAIATPISAVSVDSGYEDVTGFEVAATVSAVNEVVVTLSSWFVDDALTAADDRGLISSDQGISRDSRRLFRPSLVERFLLLRVLDTPVVVSVGDGRLVNFVSSHSASWRSVRSIPSSCSVCRVNHDSPEISCSITSAWAFRSDAASTRPRAVAIGLAVHRGNPSRRAVRRHHRDTGRRSDIAARRGTALQLGSHTASSVPTVAR